MGTLLRKMLNFAAETEESEAAKELLIERLALVPHLITQRGHVVTERQDVVVNRRSSLYNNTRTRQTSIICEDGSNRNALLFLQLVEQLALRCIALHDSWTKVEDLSVAAARGGATNPTFNAKNRNRIARAGGFWKRAYFSAVV
jgi:hypothetical protein